MISPPAHILRKHLVALGLGTLPSASPGGAWPIFAGTIKDEPDNAVCVYDTGGIKHGRLMAGETIINPGFNILIRSVMDYNVGYTKAAEIHEMLDAISDAVVDTGDNVWVIRNVILQGNVIHVGQEEGKQRRLFTINGTLVIEEN